MPGNFMPHVRVMDEGYTRIEEGRDFGLPYVVKRAVRPYDTATLNYNWQVWDTQAYSLYTTRTTGIDPKGAGQAVMSVMNFLAARGIIKYQDPHKNDCRIISDSELVSVRTAKSGIFEALAEAGESVSMGQPLAEIIHPYDGEIMETLYAPMDGRVFFIHNEPLTYANTAVIKLVAE